MITKKSTTTKPKAAAVKDPLKVAKTWKEKAIVAQKNFDWMHENFVKANKEIRQLKADMDRRGKAVKTPHDSRLDMPTRQHDGTMGLNPVLNKNVNDTGAIIERLKRRTDGTANLKEAVKPPFDVPHDSHLPNVGTPEHYKRIADDMGNVFKNKDAVTRDSYFSGRPDDTAGGAFAGERKEPLDLEAEKPSRWPIFLIGFAIGLLMGWATMHGMGAR